MYHLNLEQIITFELGSEHISVNMLKSVFQISKFVKKKYIDLSIYLSIYLCVIVLFINPSLSVYQWIYFQCNIPFSHPKIENGQDHIFTHDLYTSLHGIHHYIRLNMFRSYESIDFCHGNVHMPRCSSDRNILWDMLKWFY